MASRPLLFVFATMAALGAGSAQAEVRIMMRPGPNSPTATEPAPVAAPMPAPAAAPASAPAPVALPVPVAAPAAAPALAPPAAVAQPAETPALRRGDSDGSVSETAAEPLPLPAAPAKSAPREPARASAEPKAPAAAAQAPQEHRSASLLTGSAPTPTAPARRRNQTPDEFRDRCATDGGMMQGGGKYGLCVIR